MSAIRNRSASGRIGDVTGSLADLRTPKAASLAEKLQRFEERIAARLARPERLLNLS
jgi:hypothetical protein